MCQALIIPEYHFPFSLSLLSVIFYCFPYRGHGRLLLNFPKYLMFLGVILKVSVVDFIFQCTVTLWKCSWFLCPTILLSSFFFFYSFFRIILCVQCFHMWIKTAFFLSILYVFCFLYWSYCSPKTSNNMLNRTGDLGHLALVSILGEKHLLFHL